MILFIDELHTVVGAGAAAGCDRCLAICSSRHWRAANMQCIGATTIDEYRKHIEKDAALERRFSPVFVEEPDVETTIEMLLGLRKRYEEHHALTISRRGDRVRRQSCPAAISPTASCPIRRSI